MVSKGLSYDTKIECVSTHPRKYQYNTNYKETQDKILRLSIIINLYFVYVCNSLQRYGICVWKSTAYHLESSEAIVSSIHFTT